jgi:hypothetical protein
VIYFGKKKASGRYAKQEKTAKNCQRNRGLAKKIQPMLYTRPLFDGMWAKKNLYVPL